MRLLDFSLSFRLEILILLVDRGSFKSTTVGVRKVCKCPMCYFYTTQACSCFHLVASFLYFMV